MSSGAVRARSFPPPTTVNVIMRTHRRCIGHTHKEFHTHNRHVPQTDHIPTCITSNEHMAETRFHTISRGAVSSQCPALEVCAVLCLRYKVKVYLGTFPVQ